jgi:hypothetical protein
MFVAYRINGSSLGIRGEPIVQGIDRPSLASLRADQLADAVQVLERAIA